MNNILKRVSASLMAIALIGTGSAVLKSASPESYNTITASAAGSSLKTAVDWAISIANDNKHGYSQTNRNGNPDYDCSSFVVNAMKNAGINVGNASFTGNMKSEFTKYDFEWVDWSQIKDVKNLQYGDVLFYRTGNSGHTEIYIGNGQNVGAHTDYDGKSGDSTGKEICISTCTRGKWQGVLRYKKLPFTDVSESAWYYRAAKYVYNRGIMSGTSNTTFSPNSIVTRAQFVTALYNIDKYGPIDYQARFIDVPDNQWYTKPVLWAYYFGITNGVSETKFGTNTNITREQMAAMLYRYAKVMNLDNSYSDTTLNRFSDRGYVSPWATESMKWAVSKGIISGTSTTTLAPQANATRAECAQVMMNFLLTFNK